MTYLALKKAKQDFMNAALNFGLPAGKLVEFVGCCGLQWCEDVAEWQKATNSEFLRPKINKFLEGRSKNDLQ